MRDTIRQKHLGTTFVTLGRDASGAPVTDRSQEVGFWMRDGWLDLWLRLLALHIEEPPSNIPDFDRNRSLPMVIRNHWLLASKLGFNGCVPHGLEEATATPEGFEVVKKAVQSLSAHLSYTHDPLSAWVLNLLGFEDGWGNDVDPGILRDIADAFDDLLNFKVYATAHSRDWMPGSKRRPGGHRTDH